MKIINSTKPICAFCDSGRMVEVIDFGKVALAGGFLNPKEFSNEKLFPLRVCFCEDCYAVQVIDTVPAEILFENYFYFSSSIKTLRDHFNSYAKDVTSRFISNPAAAKVLEFGCNDGVLLKPLADQGIKTVIGVDPAKNVVSTIADCRITIFNDYFNEETTNKILSDHGKIDVVMANNVYAHIPDIQGTTRAISGILADDGVFVFEVHYLGRVVNELQYDMIYHEHLYYYSLLSAIRHFERYDMVVFDVKPVPIHAGSIRFYVCKNSSKHADSVSPAVKKMIDDELATGFNRPETFFSFAADVANRKKELMSLLMKLKDEGCSIAGYGASGRANTMIQYCGIDHSYLDYMIDDAPAKEKYFTPGSHFEIFRSSILSAPNPPDYLLIFAWSFFDEIARKNTKYIESGGKMIIPLPNVRLYP